jgi:hypothetical protein
MTSNPVSLTSVENMIEGADGMGKAADATATAIAAHVQRIQALGDFLSGDPRGQIIATIFNPVTETTAKAGMAAAGAQAGTAVKLGNQAQKVIDTDTEIQQKLVGLYQQFPNDPPTALVDYEDLQKQSGSLFALTQAEIDDPKQKLDGTQLSGDAGPYDNELTRAIAAARVAGDYEGGKNYAAFRVVGPDGSPFILVGHSDGIHSERLVGITLLDPTTKQLKAGYTVTDIYSERGPCDRNPSFCSTWLSKYFGTANNGSAPNVTYKEPYDGSVSNYQVTKNVKANASDIVSNFSTQFPTDPSTMTSTTGSTNESVPEEPVAEE